MPAILCRHIASNHTTRRYLTKQKNKNIEKLFGGKPVAGAITYLSAASAKVKAERISDPDKSVSNAIADINS